jgi:alpha-glucoside transport system permease protein
MTTTTDTDVEATVVKQESLSSSAHKALTSPWASIAAIVIALLWTIPTLGLFLTSFRTEDDINSSGWWTIFGDLFDGQLPDFTLSNYDAVLNGSDTNFATYLLNSFIITIPAVLIPISIATMAAYAFAWMSFPGRNFLFVAIFALQIVPIQVTMIPLLSIFVDAGLAGFDAPGGGFYTIWLSHSIFALPLAIYLLHNFMSQIPGELIESARVDGAGHVQIFRRIMLPLMAPAIAAFGIFQFLWVWNDLLVALVFGNTQTYPVTARLAELSGSRGQDWFLLSAGAFVALIVPLVVFLALQRFFVRGLLAGSVKG